MSAVFPAPELVLNRASEIPFGKTSAPSTDCTYIPATGTDGGCSMVEPLG